MLTQESIKLIKNTVSISRIISGSSRIFDFPKPLPCPVHALSIIKDMCQAAQKCGVGPMAAVAGAIAQYVGQDLSKLSREIIVENGGDIYIKSNKERIIGVYAGDSPLSGKIGIRIEPEDCPLGVCTSSGKIGHSLSFGRADAVVIISKSAVLADAAATAIGNMVKKVEDIQRGVNTAKNIEGVSGVLVIMEDKLGAWGNIELVKQ